LRKANHTFCHGKRPQDLKKAFELYHKFLPQHIRLRHLGSAAFELSQLIMGGTDSYISVGVRPWDIAAGICIVREAGGKVTDGNGKPWHFGAQTMIATNGKIHRALIEFINT
jgi:myo-inositol-1(or 4)-monophosphatase